MAPLTDAPSMIRLALLLLGFAIATYVGSLIGESDWFALAVLLSIAAITFVTPFTVRHLVGVFLAVTSLDFWIAPAGFKISPMELMVALAGFSYLVIFWRHRFNPDRPKGFYKLASFTIFTNITLVALGYALIHFIYNFFLPYDELSFGWRGASKAYLQTFGAFFLIVFVSKGRLLFPLNERRSTALLKLMLAALILNVVLGVFRAVKWGVSVEAVLSLEEQVEMLRLFTIPFLNAYDNVYTLRTLGPASALIGATFLFSRPRKLGPLIPGALMFFGLVGSVLSGGRATVLFSIGLILTSVVRSGRGLVGMTMAGFLIILLSLLLVVPASFLKETPWHFQRSISWLRPDLRTNATEGIQSSTDMRSSYFNFAWEAYKSGGLRTIIFGRSAGQMDDTDILSFILDNQLAQMEFAVRRLSTHNGLTDILLGWGALGYVLNLAMCISCCVMLFSYSRQFRNRSHGSCWLFSAGVLLVFWLVYTHIGGSFVWPLAIALVLVALSQTDGLVSDNVEDPQGPLTAGSQRANPSNQDVPLELATLKNMRR